MRERGAVSIFIVIFTALLVTVVTTSFVQVTLRNQQQANDNDLSQSAYDSAMAGVEDAKRALVRLKKCQLNPVGDCAIFIDAMADAETNCEVLGKSNINVASFQGTKHEVMVGDASQNQAYTCTTIKVQTESYKGELNSVHDSVVIPLVPVGGDTNNIQKVRISWFTKDDVAMTVPAPLLPATLGLPSYLAWSDTTPPMIRAQLMQFHENSINLSEFDGERARTLLLFPNNTGGRPVNHSFTSDTRRATSNSPSYGGCNANFGYGADKYACSVEIELPAMGPGEKREAYLQLAGIYIKPLGTHYMVEMLGAGGVGGRIDFDNVQPEVDSTGRSADLFRRVKARVDVSESGVPDQYPEAALSTNNICKEFFVTSNPADYSANGNGAGDPQGCTP